MAKELTLEFEHLPPASEWVVEYDKKADTLFMRIGPARPATSVDVNGEIWARLDPTTGDIVGFEIEGFRDVFLVRHPELPRPTTRTRQREIEKQGWLQAFFAMLSKLGAEGESYRAGGVSPI